MMTDNKKLARLAVLDVGFEPIRTDRIRQKHCYYRCLSSFARSSPRYNAAINDELEEGQPTNKSGGLVGKLPSRATRNCGARGSLRKRCKMIG